MGSWKLGRIAGIDISLHWTLLLLVAIVALSAPAGGALWQVTLVAALFGCVLLHELGHALAARQFGIGTHGITLLLFGGIATLERMPRRPLQELWIAVAPMWGVPSFLLETIHCFSASRPQNRSSFPASRKRR